MKGLLLFNTVAGVVLATGIGILGIKTFSHTLYSTDLKASGYTVDVNATGASKGPELPPDWATLFNDPAKNAELVKKGEADAKVCASCHDITPAGTNKTGPGLAGVVGRPGASHPGFAYSDGMTKTRGGKAWGYDDLNTFLTSPKAFVPGTKMSFAGFGQQQKRIEVIAYLRSISPNAPTPPAAAKPADAGKDAKGATNAAAAPAGNATNAAAAPAANAAAAPAANATNAAAAPAANAAAAPAAKK